MASGGFRGRSLVGPSLRLREYNLGHSVSSLLHGVVLFSRALGTRLRTALFDSLVDWPSICLPGLSDHGFRVSCGVGGGGLPVFGYRPEPQNVAHALANVAGLSGVRRSFPAAHPARVQA